MINPMITPELLRQLLRYEPDTGKLFWLPRNVGMFTDGAHSAAHNAALWKSRFEGKEALKTINCDGYRHGNLCGHTLRAHRVAWAIFYGKWPDRTDHINGVRADNRIVNLRDVTNQENMRNQKKRKNNTSGATGVSWDKEHNRWLVQIMVESGKNKKVGRFDDFGEAVAARKSAEIEHGFHANHGR